MKAVTLYVREGCHLCDRARAVLRVVAEDIPFELSERDIDEDEELLRRYFDRIPVVTIDGRERFELRVIEDILREELVASDPPS